jgi:hypothetical protein
LVFDEKHNWLFYDKDTKRVFKGFDEIII